MEGAAAQTILGNVGELVGKEFWQLAAVGGEVAELRDELATMNSLLRMQTEAEECAVDHFIREWMKQVRELAYDADDCIHLYVFHIKCRPRGGFLVRSKRLFATLFPRRRLAVDIRALRARAVAISERHARYGVSRKALRRPVSLSPAVTVAASEQALRRANEPGHFVGIQGQASTLAKKVKAVNGEEGDSKLKVFSIVGFGGLGKTTLAVEVCRQLEAEFDRRAQVSVSQAFDSRKDLKGLLQRLLEQIAKSKAANEKGIDEEKMDSVGDIYGMDVEELASKLKDLLEDKRYLIMIDDVWTIAAWDAIRCKLPDSERGSRIIVTTRIKDVAEECSDASVCKDCVYQIEPLGDDDSKQLFVSRAFVSVDASSCPSELEVTMDKILKKCAGLPLAIVSIASLLANYTSPDSNNMWTTICESIGSQMESNRSLEVMRHILTLSYNHLPYHLKGCMMYLSIFVEDFEISTNDLLYRWIAEGLVEERRGSSSLAVAQSYFDELISRNMIIPASSIGYNGRREACRVHDMMLEVMVSKSLEANFVSLVGGQQYEGMTYDRIRRLSIHGEEEVRGKRNRFESMNVQHVRSLNMFDLQEHTLLDRLGEFTLLRVLDLKGCRGVENKHVLYVCRMYLLRFLSLRWTSITELPQKIGELEHLQMLDIGGTGLENLPETMTKLEKLERVFFRHKEKWNVMWTPPRGLSKMKALREVNYIIVNDVEVAKEIGELGQLEEIGIWVQGSESRENKDLLRELVFSLSKMSSLRCFSIGRFGQGDKGLNFLHDMPSPPRHLRKLDMDGGIDELPKWVGSLPFLTEIRLMGAGLVGDQLFGALCKLPNLQIIQLGQAGYIDGELVARTTHNFPVLRVLDVAEIWCGGKLIEFEKGSMDKLEELKVLFGNNHGRRILGIEHLTNLKTAVFSGGEDNPAMSRALDELKEESKRRLQSNQFEFTVGGLYV